MKLITIENRENTRIIFVNILLWTIILLVIATLLYYGAIVSRKEVMVNYTLGNSIYIYVMKSILTDLLVFAMDIAIIMYALHFVTAVELIINQGIIVLGVLLCISTLANCTLFFWNGEKCIFKC